MGKIKVGIFVQTEYSKKTYSIESYNVRLFPGIELVKKELEKNDVVVEYCSSLNVNKYKIILASITSQCDWLYFVKERLTWEKGDYKIIVGGFGVLNYKPFYDIVDYFYLGRCENDIYDIIRELWSNNCVGERNNLIDSKNLKNKYYIRQVDAPYDHEYELPNGEKYKEKTIGCQRKCLFCSYTWHRKFTGGLQKDSGIFHGDTEKTIFEILDGNHENLSSLRMVGIDGISQRLRYQVNKKISNDDVVELFKILDKKSKPHHIKLYNICGYWNETCDDYKDFSDVVGMIEQQLTTSKWCIELHSTPFRPMPATPLSHLPTQYKNFRGEIAKCIRNYTKYNSYNSVFFNGEKIFALETMGTESLSTVIIDMIVLRGTEKDGENFKKLASNKKFYSSNSSTKINTLEKYFDVEKLFGEYQIGELPTEYLKTYTDYKIVKK